MISYRLTGQRKKHMNSKRRIAILLTLAIVVPLFACLNVSAAKTLTEGVSILNPRQNMRGEGYFWDNPKDTLTLSDLRIDTEDEYGLKITDGATVILKGDNRIKATKAALYIGGNVIFRGNGTLTLEGGETGILCNSTNNSDKLSITSGTFNVRGGTDAVKAEYSKVAMSGSAVLNLKAGKGYAANVRELIMSAGVTVDTQGSLYSSYSMLIQGANLTVSSDKAALLSDGTLKLESMKIKAGDSSSSLSDIAEYSGEKAITAVSTLDTRTKSILFGDRYPVVVDIILLIAVITALAAAVVVPIVVRKKKAAAVIEQVKLAEAEAKKLKKEAKKNR